MVLNDVLTQVDSEGLSVLAVWMPCLPGDNAEFALSAESLLPDSRVVHYWDDDSSLGTLYGRSLALPNGGTLAWDVYFVFAPGVEWGIQPPMPTEWMHRLGKGARLLDGDKLRELVLDLFPEPEAAELALGT